MVRVVMVMLGRLDDGGRHQVVVVEVMVRIGGRMMQSRIVHVHQRIDGEAVIDDRHLAGDRIVTVQCECVRRETRWLLVDGRQTGGDNSGGGCCRCGRLIQTGFLFEVVLAAGRLQQRRGARHQLDRFDVDAMMVQMMGLRGVQMGLMMVGQLMVMAVRVELVRLMV